MFLHRCYRRWEVCVDRQPEWWADVDRKRFDESVGGWAGNVALDSVASDEDTGAGRCRDTGQLFYTRFCRQFSWRLVYWWVCAIIFNGISPSQYFCYRLRNYWYLSSWGKRINVNTTPRNKVPCYNTSI